MKYFEKYITGRNVLLALLFYYAFFFIFYMPFSPINQIMLKNIPAEQILDLQQQGYTTAQSIDLLNALKESGRHDYIRNLWTLDLVFPVLALLSSLLLILYCVKKICFAQKYLRYLALIPVSVFLADYFENILITVIITRFPDVQADLVNTSSMMTQFKWMGINMGFMISLLLIVIMLIKIIILKISESGKK